MAAVLATSACNNAMQGFSPTGSETSPDPASNEGNVRIVIGPNLPAAIQGKSYNAVLAVQGGKAPYRFTVKSGQLPQGLALGATAGSITGKAAQAGNYSFVVAVRDSSRFAHGQRSFSFSVGKNPDNAKVEVEVTPATSTVASGARLQFLATTRNTGNSAVVWAASSGTISSSGLLTAPTVSSTTSVTVTATSVADAKATDQAMVTVTPNASKPTALTITTTSAPDASDGATYRLSLAASGGAAPYTWSIAGGSLPEGLTLDAKAGVIAGTPGAQGTFSFKARVTDAAKNQASQALSIVVEDTKTGNDFDGPAELPRVFLSTAMSDTPAPGGTIRVSAGDSFQQALDRAACGDTIELQAGATFSGAFVLPAKPCDDEHWIVIRTSAPDSSLPAEGTRMTPCYAGVASLPGRPDFGCASSERVLATISFPQGVGSGPLFLADGANHYRLVGLEITRAAGTGNLTHLLSVKKEQAAHHIIVDRVWMHGTPRDETKDGVHLSGVTNAAVIDSFFSDFHCISMSGACTDAQAVNGGTGDLAGGPYKIVNNFLEASGEAILFGGGAATKTPGDIEIRRNHFFKPMQWMKGTPGFVGASNGHPFVVKNHLELKNAQRVLIEGNVMENTWGGYSQAGYAVVLTPKNQHQGDTNVCPRCQVTDVTIRYTKISHAGGGMQIATGISGDGTNGDEALAGARYSIHDVVIDDIRADAFTGNGTLFQVANSWTTNVLNSVSINHVTGFTDPKGHLLSIGNKTSNPSMWGFTFTNNLVLAGAYPVWSTGGGDANCAHQNVPNSSLPSCFNSYAFSHNGVIGTTEAFAASRWPSGNYFPADTASLFVDYRGRNYRLASASPMRNATTSDGRDIGADIDAIEAATAGVD